MPHISMNQSEENSNLVKSGYLDVKFPPGSPRWKFGKVWHRRWVEATLEARKERTLCLKLFCSNQPEDVRAGCCYQLQPSTLFFRSCSKSHPRRAFGVSAVNTKCNTNLKAVLYLAGTDEKYAEIWMQALRDALSPPSPLVQLEDVCQRKHYVSLIDKEESFRLGLFGTYGYMFVSNNSLVILHPSSGQRIFHWDMENVKEVKSIRFDSENSPSGVFAISFRTENRNGNDSQILNFYSPTARSATKDFAETLRSEPKVNIPQDQITPSKHEKDLKLPGNSFCCPENTKDSNDTLLTTGRGKNDSNQPAKIRSTSNLSPCDARSDLQTEIVNIGPTLKRFSCSSSKILNSSVASFTNPEAVCYSDSSGESEYTPPISPSLTRKRSPSLKANSASTHTINSWSDSEYENLPFLKRFEDAARHTNDINGPDCNKASQDVYQLNTNIIDSCVCSTDEDLPHDGGAENVANTSYDTHIYADPFYAYYRSNSVESDAVYEELEVNDKEDTYVPPLPPPRPARRPTTLRLAELSSNIEQTLNKLQHTSVTSRSPPKSKPWLSPIRGMRKILGKDRKARSANPSPTEESSPKTERKRSSVKRVESEPLFIRTYDGSIVRKSLSEDRCHCSHTPELPIPFLPLNLVNEKSPACGASVHQDFDHKVPASNHSATHTLDDLHLSLNSKHSCLKHLLQSFKTGKEITCNCRMDLGSPVHATPLHFRRRQSKSLSVDIEKHFQSLVVLSPIIDQEPTASPDYCPMRPLSINGTNSEDISQYYMDMKCTSSKQ